MRGGGGGFSEETDRGSIWCLIDPSAKCHFIRGSRGGWQPDSNNTILHFLQFEITPGWIPKHNLFVPGLQCSSNSIILRMGAVLICVFRGGGHSTFFQVGVCGSDFRSVGIANWHLPLKRGACERKISKFWGLWAENFQIWGLVS